MAARARGYWLAAVSNRPDISKLRIPGTSLEGWRALAVCALALYILLFLVLNDRKVEVDFVFFSIKGNELLALVVIAALGFAGGYIVRSRLHDGRPLRPKPEAIEPAATPAPEPAGVETAQDGESAPAA